MRLRARRQDLPLLATVAVAVLLYGAACVRYYDANFFSWGVFVNFFGDNSFLGLAALGETFVILAGGIDLSVGAVIGCVSITAARLIASGWHPLAVFVLLLAAGALFGAGMGAVIHGLRLPPFLITLAGMFLARGLGFVISLQSVPIRHALYDQVSELRPGGVPATALAFILVLLLAFHLTQYTRFGRAIYAVGGSESSALLMGLPVGWTKVGVYALCGLCSAAAGLVYTLYTFSGNASAAGGLELDAIAAVVIGGTLLSGGVGHVGGTLVGVLIYGIIQTAIAFEGTLSSWWTRSVIGALLLAFVLLQKLVQGRVLRRTGT